MQKFKEAAMKAVFLLCACASVISVALICIFLFINGFPTIAEIGFFNFLLGTKWKPLQDLYGILPQIVGSIYVTAGAIIIGVPIGILCAVYMAKFCPKRIYKFMKPMVDLLAGIPSIVYGFFGLVVIVPVMRSLFGGSGKSVLTASVMLGIMILPTIISVCAVIIGALIISLLFATAVTRHILKPVNAIDVESPEIDSDYDELSPLINKIKLQNRRIESQIERLNQNRNEFNIISDNMSEGLILTDKSGNIISCNKSAASFFKASDSLSGKNILTLNRSEVFRTVIEKVSTGIHYEGQLDEDGRVFEVAGNPVFDDKSNLCGAVILVVDITEKENREKLRREFTANVSHELKTPLTSIYGIADMLRSGLVAEKDIKGFADDISKEAFRLISLVNDIIRLSQLDEGISEEKAEGNTDLKAVADEVCSRIQPIAEKSGVGIIKKLETAEISGASESLIFEMIYNLCDNAVKYNKQDGSITVSTGCVDGKAFIKISDTGIGIPTEDTERIFERFYRVDKSRSKEIGGTGLGLSIVKHIAASTGGVISVKSKLGAGTEITVEYE